ncbi:MAG: hypothetical protein GXY85_00465 [Candidatus Brocadiaceae bacterium]|nr:hypothetical protein [Candidatus Brocadiaceae bacterium]
MNGVARPILTIALAVMVSGTGAGRAEACVTPVFQFALENWTPCNLDVAVVHRDKLSADQEAAANLLRRAAHGDGSAANVDVRLVRAGKDGDSGAPLPRIELRLAGARQPAAPVWTGELTSAGAQAVLDSPARREIGRLLLGRRSAVWVLLEGGDRRQDERAAETLERMLPRLEATLQLPDPTAWEAAAGTVASTIDFAMVRVRRDDPAEAVLVGMLLGTEHDLTDFERTPIVFPVYGRGRVLYALVGPGINDRTVTRAGEFLVGPCSCIVKADHPGADLLLSVDWAAEVVPLGRPDAIAPAGLSTFLDRQARAARLLSEDGGHGGDPQ